VPHACCKGKIDQFQEKLKYKDRGKKRPETYTKNMNVQRPSKACFCSEFPGVFARKERSDFQEELRKS
jgi:hypothetical protein